MRVENGKFPSGPPAPGCATYVRMLAAFAFTLTLGSAAPLFVALALSTDVGKYDAKVSSRGTCACAAFVAAASMNASCSFGDDESGDET